MKKITAVFTLLAAVAVPRLSQSQEAKQEAKIEVIGVSVGKKLTEAQKDIFMFAQDGTRLQMTVSIPGKTFISAAREESRFQSFSDDKGTALFAPLGHEPDTDDWLGSFGPKFTGDGRICGLTIEAPGLPAQGATSLKFAADMVLRCGASPRTVEQKNVALKKGTKITVGPVPMTVKNVTVVGNQTEIDLSTRASSERIIRIRFFDAAGKEIPSRTTGYQTSEFFGSFEGIESFVISRRLTAATVKITFFDKVEKVTVPVRVETGLALSR